MNKNNSQSRSKNKNNNQSRAKEINNNQLRAKKKIAISIDLRTKITTSVDLSNLIMSVSSLMFYLQKLVLFGTSVNQTLTAQLSWLARTNACVLTCHFMQKTTF